jgi:phosphatidylglycerol:prolipoprotein diacylglycerol transferase
LPFRIGALTAVFMRLGNFMNSEISGMPTNSNFGVIFKRVDNVLRHPGQLWEALAYLIIFLIILFVYKDKHKRKDGFVFGSFFTPLFISRFLLEYFKINQVQFEEGMIINMGQALSIRIYFIGNYHHDT